MGSGFAKKKKQAKALQEQMMKMQTEMKSFEVTGTSGGGLVTITLDGENQMKGIKIKEACVDKEDIEGLEDLIRAAYSDALKQINEKTKAGMPNIPGLPGFF